MESAPGASDVASPAAAAHLAALLAATDGAVAKFEAFWERRPPAAAAPPPPPLVSEAPPLVRVPTNRSPAFAHDDSAVVRYVALRDAVVQTLEQTVRPTRSFAAATDPVAVSSVSTQRSLTPPPALLKIDRGSMCEPAQRSVGHCTDPAPLKAAATQTDRAVSSDVGTDTDAARFADIESRLNRAADLERLVEQLRDELAACRRELACARLDATELRVAQQQQQHLMTTGPALGAASLFAAPSAELFARPPQATFLSAMPTNVVVSPTAKLLRPSRAHVAPSPAIVSDMTPDRAEELRRQCYQVLFSGPSHMNRID